LVENPEGDEPWPEDVALDLSGEVDVTDSDTDDEGGDGNTTIKWDLTKPSDDDPEQPTLF
jgi:hypothetical protein